MDEQLKKLMEEIQRQKLGKVVETPANEEPIIEDLAAMEPPRPDYSNAIKKPEFSKLKEYMGNLPNKVALDPNYVAPVQTKEVYPSPEALSKQQQALKSIRDSFNEAPDQQILRMKRNLGIK
jgi:hypothetical protein